MAPGVKERLRGGFMLLKISGCLVWANLSCLIKTALLILFSALNLLPSDDLLCRETSAEPIISYLSHFVENQNL